MKKKKLAVIIGRFQPCHNGHIELIKYAYTQAENVLILIGSANAAPDIENPFSWTTRANLLSDSLPENINIDFQPIADFLYSNQDWLEQVQTVVAKAQREIGLIEGYPILDGDTAIVGHKKDSTSFYLDDFPQWEFVEFNKVSVYSAAHIREFLFKGHVEYAKGHIPSPVYQFLSDFKSNPEGERLIGEYSFHIDYQKQFAGSKYPPKFITVDATCFCKGHVLLVKRRSHPGKGLWALPGGFLEDMEEIENGIYRELREETGFNIRNGISHVKYFSAPKRSLRGRTITFVGLIDVDATSKNNNLSLPKVKGSDDAEKAKWFPLSEFRKMERKLFEDHYHIVNTMVDILQSK